MNETALDWLNRHTGFLIMLAAFLAASSGVASPSGVVLAAGITFNVNTTVDAVDISPGDKKCATSSGACSLRAAIMEADAERFLPVAPGPFTINLESGQIYTLTIAGPGEDESASGDLDIRVPISIISSGQSFVQGSSSWRDRIFEINLDAFDGDVNMAGLTITGGHLPNSTGPALSKGGGIYAHDLAHGSVQNVLDLTRCEVAKNTAETGGGIFVEDSQAGNLANTVAELVLHDSTVRDNDAANGSGGGLMLDNAGPVSLVNSTVRDNTALKDGAGIWREFGVGSLKLSNSTVSGNASQGNGGGIFNLLTTLLLDSTVSGNSSKGNGGGINNGYMLTLTNSTVSGNTSQGNGAGILNGGTATLTNSTVSGNTATASGGGVQNASSLTLNNVTVASNKAGTSGGGLANQSGSTVNLANTIVATNTASPTSPDCSGSLNSEGHNLIGVAAGCTLAGDTGGNILNQDPRLGSLQDNGGPTKTQALLAASFTTGSCSFGPCIVSVPPSPAIDTGNPAPPGGGKAGSCALTDQRGISRPLDGDGDGKLVCDMGAYEAPARTSLGNFTVTPQDATAGIHEHLISTFTWTVPEGLGWRSLDSLHLLLRDDQGTALWLRFQEITGDAGAFSLVNPDDSSEGPEFAPSSPNRLETDAATVYLETTAVDGPPGQTVTLTVDLGFKPKAGGRNFDVLVMAVSDAGEYEGLSNAGALTVEDMDP